MRLMKILVPLSIVLGFGTPTFAAQDSDATRDATRIEAKLKGHPDLRDVKVKYEQVAILRGKVSSEADRDEAESLAKAAGATRVENQIAVDSALAKERVVDSTKAKDRGAKAKIHSEVASIGEDVSNTWITAKLKEQYTTGKEFKDSAIHVETDGKGEVKLTGTVSSEPVHVKVLQVARTTKGVHHIKDELKTAYSR
jgi:osmotically-inducible protein OsmY